MPLGILGVVLSGSLDIMWPILDDSCNPTEGEVYLGEIIGVTLPTEYLGDTAMSSLIVSY